MAQPTALPAVTNVRCEGRAACQDEGYFSVMFALLLVPLMLFAALAVDVGFWYTRAMEIQRAADSAALAGVVWQPNNFSKATTARGS